MSIEMLSLRSVSQQAHGAEIARWEDFSRSDANSVLERDRRTGIDTCCFEK